MNEPEPLAIDAIHCIAVPTPYAVGPVNCYLIDGASPVLVDCGPATPEAEQALKAGLAGLGIAPRDLAEIVLTHHHPDHAGGLGWLRHESGALLRGHPRNDRWLAGDAVDIAILLDFNFWLYQYCDAEPAVEETMRRFADNAASTPHTRIDAPLAEGDEVAFGADRWQVIETPGHAGSSISLVRIDGVCLVGDTLLHRISSNALAEPGYGGEGRRHPSLPRYRQTLTRLAAMPLTTMLPGHGPRFSRHAELIERRLRNQRDRAARLRAALDGKGQTVMALTHYLFPGLAEGQLFLGLSEVIGHLDLIEEEGLVYHEGDNPARYFPGR